MTTKQIVNEYHTLTGVYEGVKKLVKEEKALALFPVKQVANSSLNYQLLSESGDAEFRGFYEDFKDANQEFEWKEERLKEIGKKVGLDRQESYEDQNAQNSLMADKIQSATTTSANSLLKYVLTGVESVKGIKGLTNRVMAENKVELNETDITLSVDEALAVAEGDNKVIFMNEKTFLKFNRAAKESGNLVTIMDEKGAGVGVPIRYYGVARIQTVGNSYLPDNHILVAHLDKSNGVTLFENARVGGVIVEEVKNEFPGQGYSIALVYGLAVLNPRAIALVQPAVAE